MVHSAIAMCSYMYVGSDFCEKPNEFIIRIVTNFMVRNSGDEFTNRITFLQQCKLHFNEIHSQDNGERLHNLDLENNI